MRHYLQIILENRLYYTIFLIVGAIILVNFISLFFHIVDRKRHLQISFLKSILQALVVVALIFELGSQSSIFTRFTNSILMSSSLLVVVLGFIFQEGLSNIVHGFILIVFKPFELGDRVKITIDGQQISGYVRSINLRNTIIQNVVNNSHVIIPNAKMDLCIIDNSHFNQDSTASYLLDVCITYESNLDKAIEIYSDIIRQHPLVYQARNPKERDQPVNILVADLADSHITLRASVVTDTIEQNFQACSDIRKALIHRFAEEGDVDIAYPHMILLQK